MRANGIVRQILCGLEDQIHRARLNAVSAAAVALIQGGAIGLAALGRAIGPRSYKHGIKRIDRLFGNDALAKELVLFYAAITRYVVRSRPRPVILVDWTEAGKTMCALTAAVPVEGRAVTIYSVTVPSTKYANVAVERAFLKTLSGLLGPDCRAILVGDAGFRAPWMKRVRAMGWDFVVRVRGRTLVRRSGESTWQHWEQLAARATSIPRDLGAYQVVRSARVEARLVTVTRRRRRSAAITPRNARAKRAARASREPWLIATSLTLGAEQIAKIYASRMQIELAFRDLKSHRFGWGFEDSRCRSTTRIGIQIMLAAVASLVTLLVGLAAEAAGLRRQFQANTVSARRVLSLVALGRAVLSTLSERIRILPLQQHMPFEGIL